MKTEVRFVRVKLPTYEVIKKMADEDDRSVSYVVNKLLERALQELGDFI